MIKQDILCTFQDDVGLCKQLLTIEKLTGGDPGSALACHILNKYSKMYDNTEMYTISLLRQVCEKIIALAE